MTPLEKARQAYAEALEAERGARACTVAAVRYAGGPDPAIPEAAERLAESYRAAGYGRDAALIESSAAAWRRATEARILARDRLYAAGGGQP